MLRTFIMRKAISKLVISAVAVSTVALIVISAHAKVSPPLAAVTITNNSNVEIRGLYVSSADSDNWGADQLGGAVISPGGTYTLSFSWNQSTAKVIAEDKDGCFLSTIVDTSSSATWTITNDSARDCG
jgi:hypothetical protein